MNDFYVYMYLRSNNSKSGLKGSPYYVGKGRGFRAFSNNRKITHRPAEDRNIQFVAESLNEADAFQIEMLLIFLHGRIDNLTGILRNLTDGGEGKHGAKHSDQWKRDQSARLLGHFTSEETKLKISLAQKGKPRPPESIRKMALAMKGRKWSPESIAKRSSTVRGRKRGPYSDEWKANISKGGKGIPKPKSLEHRLKLAEAQTGRVYSDESRAKMVASHIGKRHSEETRKRMSESHKARIRAGLKLRPPSP